jgi:hypothetical protein
MCKRDNNWGDKCLLPLVSSNPVHSEVYSIQHCMIKVCQWLVTGQWFSQGTLVSSTNKTNRHNIIEILLEVALNTITLTLNGNQVNWKLLNPNFTLFYFIFIHQNKINSDQSIIYRKYCVEDIKAVKSPFMQNYKLCFTSKKTKNICVNWQYM